MGESLGADGGDEIISYGGSSGGNGYGKLEVYILGE